MTSKYHYRQYQKKTKYKKKIHKIVILFIFQVNKIEKKNFQNLLQKIQNYFREENLKVKCLNILSDYTITCVTFFKTLKYHII